MKQLILFISIFLSALSINNFAQTSASGTWALTVDGTGAVTGSVIADSVGPYTSTNITGFAGFSFGSVSPAGLKLGATGATSWPADGSATTANSTFTGLSTGTIRYIQFVIHPTAGNNLTINSISVPLIENGSSTNINSAVGYSSDGVNFTAFNTNGLTGFPLPANSLQTITAAPSLTVGSSGSVIVRIILWRKAGSTASSSSVTVGPVVLSGSTTAAPSIILSSLGPLSFPATQIGSTSTSQSFTVSGINLTDNITVTPPAGFQIRTGANSFSTSPVIFTQSGGSVPATSVDVRFAPVAVGASYGVVACTSANAIEQDLAVNAPTYFYSKSSGNLDQLSSWTTDPGLVSGSAPINFTTPYQSFYIRNNTAFTLGANWTVSGTASQVIVGDGAAPATFTVPAAYTYSSPSTEITNQGTLVLQNSASLATMGLTVDYGGTYQHDCEGGAQLLGTFSTGSTIYVTGVAASNLWLPVNCFNVIWNCPLQTGAGKFYNIDGTLNINGNLTMLSTGTGYCGVNTGSNSRTLNIGGNLTVTGGSFRLSAASTGSGNSTVVVAGNVTVNDTGGVINLSSSTNAAPGIATLKVQGNLIHTSGTVTKTTAAATGRISFLGTTPQVFTTKGMLSAIDFIISNPAGVTLTSSMTMNGTLTLTSGVLNLGLDTLTIGNSALTSVVYTAGWVNGFLRRAFAASTGSYLFPVGTSSVYRGATVNFTTAPAVASYLTTAFYSTDPGSVGLPSGITKYWPSYWTINPDTIVGGVYNLSLNASGVSGVVSGDTKIIQRADNSIAWTVAGTFSDITSGIITDTSISGYAQFTLGGTNSSLPVELTKFDANVSGRKVNLNWSTATEQNFNKFIIERSEGTSKEWTSIGEVKGNGNSSVSHVYNFADAGGSGKLKYRLAIMDINGSKTYSAEINVTVGLPDQFRVYQNYPNPFNPSTVVAYDLPTDSYVKIELYSITGSRVAELSDGSQPAGYHYITIAMNRYGLSSGIYFYKVSGYDAASQKSFMTILKMVYIK